MSSNYSDTHLWRYLDGALPAPDTEAIERESETDAELAGRIDELRLIGDAIREGVPTPPPGFGTRVAATAQLRGTTGPRAAEFADLQQFVRRALVAAAVLAALGLGYLAFEVMPDIMASHLQAAPDPLMGPR